jgi:hypothetical protein
MMLMLIYVDNSFFFNRDKDGEDMKHDLSREGGWYGMWTLV